MIRFAKGAPRRVLGVGVLTGLVSMVLGGCAGMTPPQADAGGSVTTLPENLGRADVAPTPPRPVATAAITPSVTAVPAPAVQAQAPRTPAAPTPVAIEAHRDLWARLRAGFAMPDLPTPLVAEKERFYLQRPEALQRMFSRGSRYLHFIVEEVERRGMPTELALLPFVESAMNPVALSPAAAAGLWQFIPSTGKQYALSQNWWVDNRRDVVKSTQAALDYLQRIYEMNDRDWFLALASYNWGENAVARAMRTNRAKGLPADYLSLNMPAETRHYVPKLIALKQIILKADELKITLPEIPNRPYFATIEKTRPIDLKLAAQFAGLSVDDFVALNPAHNRPVIAASKNNGVKLPADRVDQFLKAVEQHDAESKTFASWQPYTLKPGESLDDVAQRGGVSTAELLRANGLAAGRRLLPGTQVIAPQQTVKDERQIESFEGPRVYELVAVPAVYHRVLKRETLGVIAASYGLSVDQLRALNGGVSRPSPGASLLIRPAGTQTVLTTVDGGRQVLARAQAPASPAPSLARAEPRADKPRSRPAPRVASSRPATVQAVYKPPRNSGKASGKPEVKRPRT